MALTGRKKPVLGQKKATNNFFDADHHFEPHKIGFKNFDQQSDIPKRGLEPVKWYLLNIDSTLIVLKSFMKNPY